MLRIRAEQMQAFERATWRQFEEDMVLHGKAFTPRLCEVIGDTQLRVAVRAALARAAGYGFTNRGPMRLCVELMFLCGSAFDTDPQHWRLGEILRAPGDQMQRAQQIHDRFLDYLEKVSGPGAVNVRNALRDLLALVRTPLQLANGFVDGMLEQIHRVFPKKAEYVGEAPLRALIEEALVEAERHQFAADRHRGLLVVLMFSFGHGCTNDPLYPWIARTLADQRIAGPERRAQRLEKKAVTWLEHVVARDPRAVRP